MIRKFLSILLCFVATATLAQKPDFIRTPNGPNTIVDWNLKAKTLIIPHGATLTLAGAQDSTGHIRIITATGDTSLYFYVRSKGWIKAGYGSMVSVQGVASAGSVNPITVAFTTGTNPKVMSEVVLTTDGTGKTITNRQITPQYDLVFTSSAHTSLVSVKIWGNDDGTGHLAEDVYYRVEE